MVIILCKAPSEFEFDALVDAFRSAFAGTSTISEDYYTDRLLQTLEIARANDWSIDSHPIECLRRVGNKHGLQRHIKIPISPTVSFDTRIDKLGVLQCELVDASKVYTNVEVLRVHYDVTALDCLTVDLESSSHGEFQLCFHSPEGVRVLDEGQLCEFWNNHSSPNGWLWQVLDGGWLSLERQRDRFYLEDMTPGTLLEYFIVADQCVSILTRIPPLFSSDSSTLGTVA